MINRRDFIKQGSLEQVLPTIALGNIVMGLTNLATSGLTNAEAGFNLALALHKLNAGEGRATTEMEDLGMPAVD